MFSRAVDEVVKCDAMATKKRMFSFWVMEQYKCKSTESTYFAKRKAMPYKCFLPVNLPEILSMFYRWV
jgi:hypothetical protein